jgi:hypothetical protein
MSGLRLVLTAPPRLQLDEALVAVVTLVNDGDEPVVTTSRLSLVEGDLDVVVSGPAGTLRAGWPWQVDSGQRQVELTPGQAIEGGVLLITAAGTGPLFPVAGFYQLVAELTPSPAELLRSAPVMVERPEPVGDDARSRARALQDRDVAASIASASLVGGAAAGLQALSGGGPVTRLLASLATSGASGARDDAADVAARVDPVTAAAALTSVLPAGLASADERFTRLAPSLEAVADDRARALLRGAPRPFG